ncbi:MAG: ABC transporter ATP-binding protein [Planctomycetales bacterium]|nr:ABC transporter ATP-binding protein [Planctomycetales bacterium]
MPLVTSSSRSVDHSIVPYLWPGMIANPFRLVLAVACLLISVVLRLIEPWPLQFVIDRILVPVPTQTGFWWDLTSDWSVESLVTICAVSFVILTTARAMADFTRTVLFSMVGNQVVSNLRERVFRHLQSLSLAFHQKSRGGDLTVRIVGDMNMLKEVMVSAGLPLASSVLLLLGMFSYMLYLNWQLGLMVVSVLPLYWILAFRKSRLIHQAASVQRKREGALAATAAESLAAVKSVQAHSAHEKFNAAFASQNKKSLREGVKTSRLTASLERSVDVMTAIASALVLWQGTRFVLDGSLTAGGLVVYLTYLKRGFKPLQDFAKYTGRISKALAAGNRITEILQQSPSVVDLPTASIAPKLRGTIEFRKVCFGYRSDAPMLTDLSFQLEAGQSLAIIGPSGIGKSTMLSLLMRLHAPKQGQVMIDGYDPSLWTLQSFRSQLGIVLQESAIFSGTVRDNIALSVPDASMEQVLAAAQVAQAHQFICKLELGYETILGERGADLSQGQRQRLAIARAILTNPQILILDEPTSNLDWQNSHNVVSALRCASRGRTTLVVTHDLHLAASMDRVLVLNADGRYQFGSPGQLLASDRSHCNTPSSLRLSEYDKKNADAVRC